MPAVSQIRPGEILSSTAKSSANRSGSCMVTTSADRCATIFSVAPRIEAA
jgi:hypothetical protein